MKTVREIPEGPANDATLFYSLLANNIFPTKNKQQQQHVCAKYFRNFAATVLDTVTTKFDETGADLIYIT